MVGISAEKIGPILERIVPCPAHLSMRLVDRGALTELLSRQGPREDGVKGQIESAYLDKYGTGDPRYGVIGVFWKDELLGGGSFAVIENPNFHVHSNDPSGKRKNYGRIDAVVVPPEHRGYGLGRWLVESCLIYMLEAWRGELYSLSTIAAHKAIAFILITLGFNSEVTKEGSVEEKVSSAIDDEREQELRKALEVKMEQTGMRVAYKIRQAGNLKV